ncbi:CotY/CotZ family spore coat protein [Schinkia sp. CFF1]
MSCGKGNQRPGMTSNCVCDVVRAIAEAQNEVIENVCDVSCERSIESLLDPAAANDLNTVPFILYGQDLMPFKGFGIDFLRNKNNQNNVQFECIESFIFRVKTVDEDCCAVIELLAFGQNQGGGGGNNNKNNQDENPCNQINGQKLEDLVGTGICITVDLSCFCAITCLPAVSLA